MKNLSKEEQPPPGESVSSPRPVPEQGMTGREFFTYLLGSYLIAAILNVGFGLIVSAAWRTVLGGTMVLGLILFGVTLVDVKKKERTSAGRGDNDRTDNSPASSPE